MTAPTVRIHEGGESAGGLGEVSCGICRRQISRYTCPSCNLHYCSLNCFQSESHSQCSEKFYRREVEINVESNSSEAGANRNKTIELLRRMEDQSAVDEDWLFHHCDGEDEGDNLAHRFSAIDISSASADDLLRLLTNKERDKFFVALKDPSSRLVLELLESVELEKTRQLPWWDAPCDDSKSSHSMPIPYGVKPNLMGVPTDLINQASPTVSLLYNICAVLLAYTYVTHHLAMSPLSSGTSDTQDRSEARKILSQAVPFLIGRKSKLLHLSLTDAVFSLWSRLDPGSIDNKTMFVLLDDVAKFVRPRRVIVMADSSGGQERTAALAADHPCATIIMVISDLSSLFSDSSAVVRRRSHIEMKLTFYAAHILSTPPSRLDALADEVLLLSKRISEEALVTSRLERLVGS